MTARYQVGFQLLASPDLHDRVAFLLPGIPIHLKVLRKKAYPNDPRTLGEHFLKRRLQAGKLQREVAADLGVKTWTYLLWENDRSTPEDRYYPRIFYFLGYNPCPVPTTLD